MSVVVQCPLPENFHPFRDAGFSDPDDPNRPTRMCVCFSDIHLTDGTAGDQSADAVIWEEVFLEIADQCVDSEAVELIVVLAGDVADVIRSAQWSRNGVYPWQRDHPKFKEVLRSIVCRIAQIHASPPSDAGMTGLFHLLQQLPQTLKEHTFNNKSSKLQRTKTLVLLGNHDKEILADDESLKILYEQCLGQRLDGTADGALSEEYLRWVGAMYFGDEGYYLDRQCAPWLPLYWGDHGFRLFVTHGQWRDPDNVRRIGKGRGRPGWDVADGWRLDVWRQLNFAPFTEPCFGDTVAAGLLSGFIDRTKQKLSALPDKSAREKLEMSRLLRILDELDLYRPTSAAVRRIIGEIKRLREFGDEVRRARETIENEVINSIHMWLGWEFTMASAAPRLRWLLRLGRRVIGLLKFLARPVELSFIDWGMGLLARRRRGEPEPQFNEMATFPGFLEDYRRYGFRIHAEGHTHNALQEEPYFDAPPPPAPRPNYTYINFGTWRDSVVPKKFRGYRRRSIGRVLVVLDVACDKGEREFSYWVQDVHIWGDRADRL